MDVIKSGLSIAIDGPASSGKGTVARGVANRLDYQYVDTGALYRSVALFAHRRGISWDDEPNLAQLTASLQFEFKWDGDVLCVWVNDEDVSGLIRSDLIGKGASDVSTRPAVRDALLGLQRALGAKGRVVMDGRDIGTVVLPEADLKVYLDANLEIRTQRRLEELRGRGQIVEFDSLKQGIQARDTQDMNRAVAPLKRAEGAHYVDTSDLSIDEAIAEVETLARWHLKEIETD